MTALPDWFSSDVLFVESPTRTAKRRRKVQRAILGVIFVAYTAAAMAGFRDLFQWAVGQ